MWRRPLFTRASILSAGSARDQSKRIAARDRRNEAIKLRLMRRLKVKSGTVQ
jgi:ribosomal protein S30